jgi:hypothetical protein
MYTFNIFHPENQSDIIFLLSIYIRIYLVTQMYVYT